MVLVHALGDLASEYFEPLLPKSLITVARKSRYSLLFASGRWTDVFAILSKFHIFGLAGVSVTIHWFPHYRPRHYVHAFQPRLTCSCVQSVLSAI